MDKLKQFRKRFNKVKDDMNRWDNLQRRFVSEFTNASYIILRLPVIRDSGNFMNLGNNQNFQDKLLVNQMDSLQTIMVSMKQTLDQFDDVMASFEKTVSDGRQSIKDVPKPEQMISFNSSLAECLAKLETLSDMHRSEYRLKSSLFEALWPLTFKPNTDDMGALLQILVDQPNIPRDKIHDIFDSLIFPANPCEGVAIHI